MPRTPVKDCQGNPLVVGAEVAFNCSGAVVPGCIKSVIPRWKIVTWGDGSQWDGSFLVHNHLTGTVSKVKRPESLLVILP